MPDRREPSSEHRLSNRLGVSTQIAKRHKAPERLPQETPLLKAKGTPNALSIINDGVCSKVGQSAAQTRGIHGITGLNGG